MSQAEIGVIGGSGLYILPDLVDLEEVELETPWGDPSEPYMVGTLRGKRIAFLSRHGSGHRLMPTEINYRANIYGFRMLGVDRILSFSAVGSLREDLKPLSFLLPDQFVDRTRHRADTFFGEGLVAHISFADPICPVLLEVLDSSCRTVGLGAKRGGTYLCMEGPAFSTKAESNLYRSWGMDVIGMTNLTEAKLAREAEICYVTVAMVTDYDCWHPDHDSVTVQQIIGNLNKNSENAIKLLSCAILAMPKARTCRCGSSLADAIITTREKIAHDALKKVSLLVAKYLPPEGE